MEPMPPDEQIKRTEQSGNVVGKDLIGRDKYESKTTIQIQSLSATGALSRLLERLHEEEKTGVFATNIIEELKRFEEPQDPVPVGVEKKLQDGNRADLIDFATRAKEQFVKKLAQNTFFESAQEIHALLLSKIYSVFTHQVAPAIKSGADRSAVDALIRSLIIEPIVADLQATSFRYYDDHVQGMLYYLTGNCYVKWT